MTEMVYPTPKMTIMKVILTQMAMEFRILKMKMMTMMEYLITMTRIMQATPTVMEME